MVLPFRFGAGGPLGSGRQYVPWIHIDDLIDLLVAALQDERLKGPMLATAPHPVTSSHLTTAMGAVLQRPSFLPVPAFVLRMVLGEAATAVLTGQRVCPRRLKQAGFVWCYPRIESALADILRDHDPEIRGFAEAAPKPFPVVDSDYLTRHRPRFVLSQKTLVRANMAEVFRFFSNPHNLGVMTPSSMRFRILGEAPDQIRRGLRIGYAIKLGPFPLRWRTLIEEWQPPSLFADSQESGPYACWWHEHHFHPDGGCTLMEDRLYYAPPLGGAGAIANQLFVASALRRIFAYRSHALRLRFGRGPKSPDT